MDSWGAEGDPTSASIALDDDRNDDGIYWHDAVNPLAPSFDHDEMAFDQGVFHLENDDGEEDVYAGPELVGNGEVIMDQKGVNEPPSSRFGALSLVDEMKHASTAGEVEENGQQSSSTHAAAISNIDEDPFAALEAAIEADKPKQEVSQEWQRMMESVHAEQSEGGPIMVPPRAPNASVAAETRDVPLENDNGHTVSGITAEQQQRQERPAASPSRVVSAAEAQVSATSDSGVDQSSEPSSSAATAAQQPPSDSAQSQETGTREAARKQTFAELQPLCSRILGYRDKPSELAALLVELRGVAAKANQQGLQDCLDYVIFPLMLAIDALVAIRDQEVPSASAAAEEKRQPAAASAALALPAMTSDKAAEATMSALLGVLERCYCARGEQLLSVLQRVCSVIMAPRERMSEELRFSGLRVACCALNGVQREDNQQARQVLRNEENAAFIGLFSSMLLQCSATEQAAGTLGNKAVRAAALRALRAFIETIDSAEALGFFLPGLMTGLARALLPAGHRSAGARATRGATGGGSAFVEAISALSALVRCTLGDAVTVGVLGHSANAAASGMGKDDALRETAARGFGGSVDAMGDFTDVRNAEQALANLEAMAAAKDTHFESSKPGTARACTDDDDDDSLPEQVDHHQPPPQQGDEARLRVEGTSAWIQASAAKVTELLQIVLPPLASDDRPAVKLALLDACCVLLLECHVALDACQPYLLDIVFALAQDEWPQVREAASRRLQSHHHRRTDLPSTPIAISPIIANEKSPGNEESSHARTILVSTAEKSLQSWLESFPQALRKGDEAGRAHALKLATCLQVCSPASVVARLLYSSAAADMLTSLLCRCVVLDADIAGVLLYSAHVQTGPGGVYSSNGSNNVETSLRPRTTTPANYADKKHVINGLTAISSGSLLLPRMPLALQYISTVKTWEAVTLVLRTLATVAASVDAEDATSAPGTALRLLVDECVNNFQRHVKAGLGDDAYTRKGGARSRLRSDEKLPRPGAQGAVMSSETSTKVDDAGGEMVPWQLAAAQAIILLQEIIFGAAVSLETGDISQIAKETCAHRETSDNIVGNVFVEPSRGGDNKTATYIRSLVSMVLEEIMDERIMNLQTVADTFESSSSPLLRHPQAAVAGPTPPRLARSPSYAGMISAKERGCNAVLQRTILEFVGVAARAFGPPFLQHGRMLRATLLPTLEKLGDPVSIVSTAASAAVASICGHCGLAGYGLRQLVADNADYVVDGMCQRLRQPDKYPSGPRLFAALLGQGGVAPALIPLLAEPARQALQGISIIARRKRPEHMLPFLLSLREIARGATVVAEEASGGMEALTASMRQRSETQENEWLEECRRAYPEHVTADDQEFESLYDGHTGRSDSDARIEKVARYFAAQRRRRREKNDEAKAASLSVEEEGQQGEDGDGDDQDDVAAYTEQLERVRKVAVTMDAWNDLQMAKRRGNAAGNLAQSVADCAGSLATSSSLPAAVQALGACSEALKALQHATICENLYKKHVETLVKPPGGISFPTDSSPPAALLPSVHLMWLPLMACLDDWRVVLVESALMAIVNLASLAGDFIARRFRQEAWPRMQRLLKEGPSQQRLIAPGQDDVSSPAVVQRAQRAVLLCLRDVAAGSISRMPNVIVPIALPALMAIAEVLGDAQPAAVREMATEAFVAVARLDSDAAWALLAAGSRSRGRDFDPVVVFGDAAVDGDDQAGLEGFPPLSSLLHPPPLEGVPQGLRGCSIAKLHALTKEVRGMEARWHADVAKLCA